MRQQLMAYSSKMHRVKTNQADLSNLPQGRVDHARLDATSEEDIQNHKHVDDAELVSHIGTTLDSLLEAEGFLEDVTETAIRRIEIIKSRT